MNHLRTTNFLCLGILLCLIVIALQGFTMRRDGADTTQMQNQSNAQNVNVIAAEDARAEEAAKKRGWYKPADVARQLGVTRDTVYDMLNQGRIYGAELQANKTWKVDLEYEVQE